jgi:hypothetical protein
MKKLVLVLCLAALAAPAVAGAKELQGAELCGPDGCRQQRSMELRAGPGGFNGPYSGLGGIVQPAAPAPFYRGSLLIGEGGKVFMRVPFFYVPDAELMVQPGNGSEQPAWWHPEGALKTIVESLAARIRPNPVPAHIAVTANGTPVTDPQSYLRLFTIGGKTDKYPTEDSSVQLTFTSPRSTPWTTGNVMVLYPKSHLFIRDGQMVALPADTSDRIVRGASLAPGSSFPWLPAAAGVAVVVLAAAIVRRLRPRAAPRPVTQT